MDVRKYVIVLLLSWSFLRPGCATAQLNNASVLATKANTAKRSPYVKNLLFRRKNKAATPNNFTLVKRKQRVSVICSLDLGNPPIRATIKNGRGKLLKKSRKSQAEFEYTIRSVTCGHAGRYRCEAPGAVENQTATLLVKCPPKFYGYDRLSRVTVASDSNDVNFDIVAPASNLSKCSLITLHPSPEMPGKCWDCSSSANVTGTPPDLTLTVRLDDVKKEDEGLWRLTLVNEWGEGHLYFLAWIAESISSANSSISEEGAHQQYLPHQQNDEKLDVASWMTATAATAVAVVSALLLTCWLCRTKSVSGVENRLQKTRRDPERLPSHTGSQPKVLFVNSHLVQPDDCVMIPNPVYQGGEGCSNLLESSISIYEDVGAGEAARPFDIDSRPRLPLPDHQLTISSASSGDYVPISEILKRKRQRQLGESALTAKQEQTAHIGHAAERCTGTQTDSDGASVKAESQEASTGKRSTLRCSV